MPFFISNVKFNLILIVFIICLPLISLANEISNNSVLNKSIETNNFNIIYNENSSIVAQELAKNIERWGDEVFTFLGQKPKYKITVFLNNDVDIVNAFSAFTIVSLYLNNNSYAFNEFGNNWLETTFKHELAHNVTRIYDYGFWGGIVFSQMREIFIPTWMHEGSSVLTESKTSKEGRFSNPTFWSKERFLVDNNLNNYFYYYNEDPYLDGSSFYNFYYQKYGKEKTISSYGNYSGRPVLTILSNPIKYFAKSINKSDYDLLKEWQISLKKKYSNEKSKTYIEGSEIKLHNYIIQDLLGENQKGQLVFSANKKNVLTNKYEKYLLLINSEGDIINSRRVDNNFITSFSYNIVDDSVTYTKLAPNNFSGDAYNIAYSTKMGVSSTKEISNVNRVYKLVKGHGNCYYYLVADNEKTALLDCNNNILVDFSENQVMEHLRYEANKNLLYFVAGKIGETTKYIYIYDIKTKQLTKVIEGLNPYIKGSNLYFSYAKQPDAILNIYKYVLNTKQIEQITDTKYGASSPIVIGNNLYYTSYSTNKDSLVISSVFQLKLNSSDAKKMVNYSEYNIDKPYDNGYVEEHSGEYLLTNEGESPKEINNNYFNLIFIPTVYTDFSSLKVDFLLATGKHVLSMGLSESNPFISFSKNNFTTLQLLNEKPLYLAGFFGEKEGSQNVSVFEFNPILFNGYGYLPTIRAEAELNSLGGNSIGGSLVGDYSYISYNFKKPKTEDTKSFGYSEINASYSIFSAKIIQVEGDGEILYGNNPFDTESENYIWKKSNINNLYMATASIPFSFYIYKGMKTGYLGYNYLTITPKISYIYTNDHLNNYDKGAILGATFSNNVRITPNVNIGLDLTLYTSKRESLDKSITDKGVFFSLSI